MAVSVSGAISGIEKTSAGLVFIPDGAATRFIEVSNTFKNGLPSL